MHQLTLGDFELSVFSDGTYPLDGGAFFGVVPKIMWSRKMAADDKNCITSGLNSLLVRTGKETVLIETGIGNKLPDRMVKFYGQPAKLLENLGAAGIAPDDIDIVINSHLHFDHCGWNTTRDKNGKIVPTFPRAKYYAPEGEWQYARKPSERDSISFLPDNYDPLVASGQMTLVKDGDEIVPGISVKTFRGHTAHMQGIIIRGSQNPHFRQNQPEMGHPPESSQVPTACYISDLMPTTRAYRSDVGHGIRSVSAGHNREQEAVLRSGASGKMADSFHARSEDAVGVHRAGRVGKDGGQASMR